MLDLFQAIKSLLSADGITPEIHIQQNNIGMKGRHEMFDAGGLCGYFNFFYIRFQQQVERKEHVLVVVNNQYFSFLFHVL